MLDKVCRSLKKAAYYFICVYLALFCAMTPILGGLLLFPRFSFPALGTLWPMRAVTYWLGTHVFNVSTLAYRGTSGDTPFHWVQLAWIAAVAASTALVAVGFRLAPTSGSAARWFRLFLRFALAGQMFYFGMAKVIPAQFPPPSLVTLLYPVGNLSQDDLLWTFMGASTPYQIFAGCSEVLAGILLVIPKTATIGAIVAFADMLQVFALNMSYDIGLKQLSFHLMAIALFLLSPQLGRITDALVDRPPQTRRALGIQLAFGLYLFLMFTRLAMLSWHNPGGPGAPKSALYGVWNVERMSIDGNLRPPTFNDYRWRRIVFDAPELLIIQRLDESFAHYGASIDVDGGRIALRTAGGRHWIASFAFDRRSDDEMSIDGEMDGHRVHVDLQRLGLDTFRLTNGTFRWVRPPS